MISIIVLHHNKAEYSRACLASLLRSSARPLEVINVDNGSRDDTPTVLDEWESAAQNAGVTTQRLNFDSNIGAIRGRNEAMNVAQGKYFVFLDNDTLVAQRDWLEQLQVFLDEDSQRGIVAPKLLFPWEPFQIECCGAAVSPGGRIQYLGRGQARESWTQAQPVQCLISAAWMMTRRLYEEVGALDEIYSPVQYEDLDLCYRARQQGFGVWVLPAVELFHFEHTTTAGSGDINFKYVTTKNGITFKKRWQSTFQSENGASEADTQWLNLPKQAIEEIDWEQLLPAAAP
jgi:GT2 family glycosyltransferase